MALTRRIIAFEQGELNHAQSVELFQELVDTGLAWKLRGSYGGMAARLLEQGIIHPPVGYTDDF